MSGPETPRAGRKPGRWQLMGQVGVDGASVAVIELIGMKSTSYPTRDFSKLYESTERFALNEGVNMMAGFGDGSYEVWGWIVDYGTEDRPDERIAQFTVTLIAEKEDQL